MNTFPNADDGNDSHYALFTDSHVKTLDGSEFVHKDLVKVVDPWAVEEHELLTTTEKLGDVESWAAYVKTHASAESDHHLLTWNKNGLSAVLDYPSTKRWTATHPFVTTAEFRLWTGLATGHAVELSKAVEFLEDNALDIHEPDASSLLDLLRKLKANVTANADVELRADGTAKVRFDRDTTVRGTNEAELPNEITIAIPVLKGHVEPENDSDRGVFAGQPVRYKLVLKLRASVDANARLSLRFNMPVVERVLEEVYAERVGIAKGLLDGYAILRAAD